MRWALITTAGLLCVNGGVPVSNSYVVAASAYWSARPSMWSPRNCSGAAYATVPTVMFVPVNPLASPAWRAMPKSASIARSPGEPGLAVRMFAGFTSR